MKKNGFRNDFLKGFVFITSLNILLYIFIASFYRYIPFHHRNYKYESHHFITDPRSEGKSFDLIVGLGQYDAQWYLRIASRGYPAFPKVENLGSKEYMDAPTYAFFPFYSILLHLVNVMFRDLSLSAFILAIILMYVAYAVLFFAITDITDSVTALRTSLLIFTSPFSIFFRSYFPETLFLTLLILFGYFWVKKRYTPAVIALGLSNVTKANGLLLNAFIIVDVWKHFRRQYIKFILCVILLSLPFAGWIMFNYQNTHDPLYFKNILRAWGFLYNPLVMVAHNLISLIKLPFLPLYDYHYNVINTSYVLLTVLLLKLSYKKIPTQFWIIALVLCVTPIITKSFMSYERYQSVSFPLFMYLAKRLHGISFIITIILFTLILFGTSIFFVNWYFVG